MKQKKALVVGNWKMNPTSLKDAKQIFTAIKRSLKTTQTSVAIAPPFVYLHTLKAGSSVSLAAQDIHPEEKGAHTGETSPLMLKDAGVTTVIIGHSERRAAGETDEMVFDKLHAALKARLIPIVCVGEKKRDKNGDFFSQVENQIKAALKDLPKATVARVVIAYEPIWAIGTGNNATVEDVEEMQLFIRKVVTNLCDRKTAEMMTILYGGSVNAENCHDLYHQSHVNGFLVGGASLRPADFATIVQSTAQLPS